MVISQTNEEKKTVGFFIGLHDFNPKQDIFERKKNDGAAGTAICHNRFDLNTVFDYLNQ